MIITTPTPKGHFSFMRQARAATDTNLFSLFWKYYALSFLLKTL